MCLLKVLRPVHAAYEHFFLGLGKFAISESTAKSIMLEKALDGVTLAMASTSFCATFP